MESRSFFLVAHLRFFWGLRFKVQDLHTWHYQSWHFFRKSRRLRRWLCLDDSGVVPGATGERPSLEMCEAELAKAEGMMMMMMMELDA